MSYYKVRRIHHRVLAATLMLVVLALAHPAISGQLASSGPSFPNAPLISPDGHGGLLISGTNDSYWHLAYSKDATSGASAYSYPDVPSSNTDYTPPSVTPCVSVQAEQGGTGHVDGKLGTSWSGFVCANNPRSGTAFPNPPAVSPDGHGGVFINGTNDTAFHIALGTSAGGPAASYVYPDLAASVTDYIPPEGAPCVSVLAVQRGIQGTSWSGFACAIGLIPSTPGSTNTPQPTPSATPSGTPNATTNGKKLPPPPPTGTPAPSSAMLVGLDDGWVSFNGYSQDKAAVNVIRVNGASKSDIDKAASAGMKLNIIYGSVNPGGVSAIDAPSFAGGLASFYNGLTATEKSTIVGFEILNEPGNPWMGWGSSALSSTNASAYDHLLHTIHSAFGSSRPKILAAYDGGYNHAWGQEMLAADPSVTGAVDGFTVHPYGGHSTSADAYGPNHSAQGNRALVVEAHTATGMPVYVTEVGWPTDTGGAPTGDSLQWTEKQQADNIYSFMNWARGLGYVNEVIYFNGHDYGTNNFYGVIREGNSAGPSGSEKLGFTSLAEAAHQQACTVC